MVNPISIVGDDLAQPTEVTISSTDFLCHPVVSMRSDGSGRIDYPDEGDYGGITWAWVQEPLFTEADRAEAEMNRDPYCERFMRSDA